MKKVLCIGSATKDIFLPLDEVKIIDNPGDVTAQKLMAFEYGAKLYASEIFEEVGGSAVNVAAGLARGGYRTFVLSRTSRSDIGKWITKGIGKLGIKKNYMQQTGGRESEVAVVVLDKKTIEHFILRTGDSVEAFDVSGALDSFDEKVHWIFVGSLKKDWQDKMDCIISFVAKKKSSIALNPSGYQIQNDAKELVKMMGKVEVLFVNRDEAIEIVKNVDGQVTDDPKYLYHRLRTFGCRVVTITDGENGAYAGDCNNIYHLGTRLIQKVDSLGAGDAFCSGFLSAYIENKDISRALAWGIANSGSVVSSVGGNRGLMDKKLLQQIGEKLVSDVKII